MPGDFRQFVPRPAGAGTAVAAPWSGLLADGRRGVPVSVVAQAAAVLGGYRATAGLRAGDPDAAVVVPVFESEGEATVVLIRRAAHLQADPGHVAMAGGHLEAGESPVEAALREAREEIGLDPGDVESVVSLGTFHRPARGDAVTAFAAFLGARPELVPRPAEVEAVLEVPVAALLADGVAWEEHWGGDPAAERTVAFFADERALGDDLIWGLTARILWALLETVASTLRASGLPSPHPT